jgi:hypothetical protein
MLLRAFERYGDDSQGKPLFILSTEGLEPEPLIRLLGPERISRIGVRCCERVRVALLQAAARSGGTKQSITLVVELGSWLEGEGTVTAWPSSLAPMLRAARELHEVISSRYASST